MDRYFYTIECDADGNKIIHMLGNVYFNDADGTETDHRHAEWTFMCLPIKEVIKMFKADEFYDFINERVAYLGDVTAEQARDICNNYFDGEPGKELHIKNANEDTMCGSYWFE